MPVTDEVLAERVSAMKALLSRFDDDNERIDVLIGALVGCAMVAEIDTAAVIERFVAVTRKIELVIKVGARH